VTDNQVIDEIKSRLNLVDIIGKQVSLKRAGHTHKGLCPFHTEKTPSFVVFPHTQTWHCFGCGEGGDLFSFVMKRDNLEFSEALRLLARQAGVQLRKPAEADIAAAKERERLREVLAAAAKLYHQWLGGAEEGAQVRRYLQRRRVQKDAVERFQLGYAPDGWDGLLRALTARGFQPPDLEKAGLIIAREQGGYYDRFRNRLLFPIRDPQGATIGFGGRTLDDDSQPKYLNSPQTPVFDKGRILFGLDMAKESIRAADEVVLVEGYMDVITAHQNNYRNVIASMGTALTREQFRQLKRLTRNLIFALDADLAGSKATQRGLERAREALDQKPVPVITSRGLVRQEYEVDADIRVLVLPEGMDPDDLIKQQPDRWEQLVRNALPVIDYLFSTAIRGYDPHSPKDKTRLTQELLPVIADVPEPVQRAHYLQKLAHLVRVDERVLERQLATIHRRPDDRAREQDLREQAAVVAPLGLEEYCVHLLLMQPTLLDAALQLGLEASDFQQVANREIFAALRRRGADAISLRENPLDEEAFRAKLDPVVAGQFRRITDYYQRQPPIPYDDLTSEMEIAVQKLKLRNEQQESAQIAFVLQTYAEQEPDPNSERALRRRIAELNASIAVREQDLHARTYAGRLERLRSTDTEASTRSF